MVVTGKLGWAVSMGPKRFRSLVSGPIKKGYADTPRIRIPAVSRAYPYRIRIRHGIRTLPGVSVFHSFRGTAAGSLARLPHHFTWRLRPARPSASAEQSSTFLAASLAIAQGHWPLATR
jgi:hypothetical protein